MSLKSLNIEIFRSSYSVIPVKTGIQSVITKDWIPAYAGMTRKCLFSSLFIFWLLLSPLSAFAPLAPKAAEAATLNRSLSVPANNLGLVGWWTFDGVDMTPNVRDRSGQGNHGNLSNQPSTTTVSGKIGQAWQSIDGSQNRVSVPAASSINDLPQMTVSLWVKPDNTGSNNWFIAKNDDNSGGHGWRFGNSTGNAIEFFHEFSGGTPVEVSRASSVTEGEWQHFVFTWDGSSEADNVHVYKDGEEFVSMTRTDGVGSRTADDARPIFIGNGRDNGDQDFAGKIDDVRIYNRILSDSEITGLYRSSNADHGVSRSPGTLQNGLIGHWTFDGKNMTPNVRDSSGQGNHGNLANFTSTTTVGGKIGQALLFDRDDQVLLPDMVDGLNTMTISAWFKANIGDDGHIRFAYEDGSLDFRRYSTDRFYLELTNNSAVTASSFSDTLYADTEWHHVVGTYDGSRIDLFVDGVDDEAATVSLAGPIATAAGNFSIGNASSGANGIIDDFRLYNRVLTNDEISQLYDMGAGTRVNASPEKKLTSGLVGYWTFDGNDMNWAANQALDKSGQGNNGTLTNMSTSTSPVGGKIGQALQFDGSNDRVATPVQLPTSGGFTVAGWVKGRPSGNAAFFIQDHNGSTDIGLLYIPGSNAFSYKNEANTSDIQGGWDYTLNNEWHHIVLSEPYSGGDVDNASFYIDGVLITSLNAGVNFSPGTQNLQIGARNDNSFPWLGVMDEVRVYNRALSASEAKQLYNMGR